MGILDIPYLSLKGNTRSPLLRGNSGVDFSPPLDGKLGVGALPSITLALAFLIEEKEYLFEIS
ncbi:MAG: hypothetical protein E3K40_04195 [Candidatus Brocadia sp.]|nr:hypothetical protein [Candidatus Brocadia sp.]MDG6025913.1 hypothetical protein [Candidatus Brocadia sp.]